MKKIGFLAIITLVSIMICSCGKAEEVTPVVTEPVETVKTEYFKNPLTDYPVLTADEVGYRPVAVMVNNIGAALPHRGLSKADIVYEVVVEGGITRIMAVFGNPKNLPYVGPIRSSRHYYVDFALPYNAIYLHFGGSPAGYDRIDSTGINNIDGMKYSRDFYQDMARANSKGKEHSYFVSADEFYPMMEKAGYEIKGETKAPFDFYEEEYFPENKNANEVFASFSGGASSTFTYNRSTGLYSKKRNGANHIDADTGEILKYKNILVLFADIGSYNGEALRRDVNLSSGKGYYVTNGRKEEISWKKGASQNQFAFTNVNGESLKVNPGKTYICIISTDRQKNTVIR